MVDTEGLIRTLAAGAGPVRRTASPAARFGAWLVPALAVIVPVLVSGLRHGLAGRLAYPSIDAGLLLAAVAAACAAIAALRESVPGLTARAARVAAIAALGVWAAWLAVQ